MQRIDTTTKAVDLFGSGKHGFQDGNPALGVAATQLNAALFNNVQEEIARVVEAAGIALDGGVYTQLLAALTAGWDLPKSIIGTGYLKLPGGLIMQWGQADFGASATSGTVTFPISFPNLGFYFCATDIGSAANFTGIAGSLGKSIATGVTFSTIPSVFSFFVIGY